MVTLCKHDALRLFDVAIEVQSRIKTMNETTQSTSSDEMQIRPKKPSPRIHTPYPWDEVTKVTESSTSKTRPKLSNFGQHTLQAKLFLRSVKAIFKEFFKTLVKNNCLDAYKAARRYVKSTSDHNKTTTFFDWND